MSETLKAETEEQVLGFENTHHSEDHDDEQTNDISPHPVGYEQNHREREHHVNDYDFPVHPCRKSRCLIAPQTLKFGLWLKKAFGFS